MSLVSIKRDEARLLDQTNETTGGKQIKNKLKQNRTSPHRTYYDRTFRKELVSVFFFSLADLCKLAVLITIQSKSVLLNYLHT